MPKILIVLSVDEIKTTILALDEIIKYSTHAEAVPFKNVRAKLQDLVIKSVEG